MGLACSAAYAGPWGTANELACVKFTQPTTKPLTIFFSQSIKDTSIIQTKKQNKFVKAGFEGEICADHYIHDDIWATGHVLSSWEIKYNDELIKSFDTDAFFSGWGSSNDWDIDDKGQCGVNSNNGVYLSTPNQGPTCGKLADVVDKTIVKATYVVDDVDFAKYNALDVLNGDQVFANGDKVYGQYNSLLYVCKVASLCNQDPNTYAPGTGSHWLKAWDLVPTNQVN